MEQYRVVDTPNGPVTYLLVRKRVKNLNLRIDRQGQVALSVPLRCPPERADALVRDKSGWILSHLHRAEKAPPLPPEPDQRECRALLEGAVDRVYPLVAGAGVARGEEASSPSASSGSPEEEGAGWLSSPWETAGRA